MKAPTASFLSSNISNKAGNYYSVQLVADWDYTVKHLIPHYDSIEGKEARNRAVIDKLLDLVKDAVEGGKGVTCVLLRAKTAPKKYIIEACYQIIPYLKPLGIPFMVNDFVDVAKITGADGVHVGQDDMPVAYARKELGKDKIIGLSITNPENARVGATEDADYYAVGPIYPTASKTDADPAIGLEGLIKIRKILANKPIIVIGGVKLENADRLIEAKANGVSVIGAIMGSKFPREAAELFNDIVHKQRQQDLGLKTLGGNKRLFSTSGSQTADIFEDTSKKNSLMNQYDFFGRSNHRTFFSSSNNIQSASHTITSELSTKNFTEQPPLTFPEKILRDAYYGIFDYKFSKISAQVAVTVNNSQSFFKIFNGSAIIRRALCNLLKR